MTTCCLAASRLWHHRIAPTYPTTGGLGGWLERNSSLIKILAIYKSFVEIATLQIIASRDGCTLLWSSPTPDRSRSHEPDCVCRIQIMLSMSLSKRIRYEVLAQSKRANVGHIGSALSVVDLLAAIYGRVLRASAPTDPERDRFVLSKGHAAIALYATLRATQRLSAEELARFCADGSPLATHPEHAVLWVDFSTGSLGMGLPLAVGAAFAARIEDSRRRVFVLLSDAECNEGSVWEAVMLAAHHRLQNLVALVDVNGQQALGYTRDVLDLAPLAARWEAFGWDVRDVDGHDVDAVVSALENTTTLPSKPRVLLAHTVFGKGVSYMENKIDWHYLPMSDEQYARAIDELGLD
jgi:transketolase